MVKVNGVYCPRCRSTDLATKRTFKARPGVTCRKRKCKACGREFRTGERRE